jgi:transposase InsO family protein
MISALEVSKSGYYKWAKNGSNREKKESEQLKLLRAIEDAHMGSRKTYGSPRVFKQLKGMGFEVSKTKVERLMKEKKIKAKAKRKFKKTTDSKHKLPVAPNLLKQDFSAKEPNKVWVTDITYIPTSEGWLFLSVILDVFSRTIVGWAMDKNMKTELCLRALRMAYFKRRPGKDLIHHSDKGSQYCSYEYRAQLQEYKMLCSMSGKGNCFDNAMAESFFHTLKTELTFHEKFETREEAKNKIFEWIEVFYNRQRLHSSLKYKSPINFELEHNEFCA